MNKAPAFQLYVADYMQDTRILSLAAKGAWMDCLCVMWRASTRGEITYPVIGYARIFGCTVEQAAAVIDELVEMQICDRVTHDDGKMTLTNRRMKREAKEREAANHRQKNYIDRKRRGNDTDDDGESDGEMTSLLQSSSSSSSSKGSGGSSRANGKPPPTAAGSDNSKPNRQWSELSAEEKQMTKGNFITYLQTVHPTKNVQKIGEKLRKFCTANGKTFALERLKGWVENEGETLSESDFLEAFGAESPPSPEHQMKALIAKKYGGKTNDA